MRIASTSFATNFLAEINQLQQRQNQLQQEASTGQKISLPEDNPQAMGEVLNLQTQAGANTQYQSNISTVQTAATTSFAAMNNLKSISDRVNQIATLATSGTASPTQLSSYSDELKNLIQQAVQLGNTTDTNGNYIFGGTKNANPPFVATSDTSGNVTAVAYQGNTTAAKTEISPNVTVTAQTPGANTTGSGPRGLFTDSRYGADLFSHMISLQQHLASGNTSAINANDAPALTKDEDNIITSISANGVLQSTLTSASNVASSQSTNLTAQISSQTSADLATTITQLTQTQTAYQAALESGTKILSLSLLDYLH